MGYQVSNVLCLINASIGGLFPYLNCFSFLSFKIMSKWSLRILLILIVRLPFGMPKEGVEFPDMVVKLLES